ncbi:MAG: hypothetical protein V4510_12760 [bacterium]
MTDTNRHITATEVMLASEAREREARLLAPPTETELLAESVVVLAESMAKLVDTVDEVVHVLDRAVRVAIAQSR